jgi:hypothetical protein
MPNRKKETYDLFCFHYYSKIHAQNLIILLDFISSPTQLHTHISKAEDLAFTILLPLDRREESDDARHVQTRHYSHRPATIAVSRWDNIPAFGPDEFSAIMKDARLLEVSAPKLGLVWRSHGG